MIIRPSDYLSSNIIDLTYFREVGQKYRNIGSNEDIQKSFWNYLTLSYYIGSAPSLGSCHGWLWNIMGASTRYPTRLLSGILWPQQHKALCTVWHFYAESGSVVTRSGVVLIFSRSCVSISVTLLVRIYWQCMNLQVCKKILFIIKKRIISVCKKILRTTLQLF